MRMLQPGLCSVTFRSLTPQAVIDLAAANGIKAIEWGGDVHVPPGDLENARQVAARTAETGLSVSSYGSYISAVAVGIFLFGVWEAFAKKRIAGNNPWGEGATTLEWQLSSPPPYHQWEQLPRIR